MYTAAVTNITIPGSVTRLAKQGYCATITMEDTWKLTVVQDPEHVQETPTNDIPITFVSRIIDGLT